MKEEGKGIPGKALIQLEMHLDQQKLNRSINHLDFTLNSRNTKTIIMPVMLLKKWTITNSMEDELWSKRQVPLKEDPDKVDLDLRINALSVDGKDIGK